MARGDTMRRGSSGRRAVRRVASWAHLYLGLVAAVVLSLVGVTGTILVFHDEIDALLAPELHHVEPGAERAGAERASLDAIVAAAAAYEPAHTPSFVRLPRDARGSVEVWTDGEEGPTVYIDPYTATVLGSQTESFTDWLFALHVELFAGEVGHWIVGSSGFALIVLVMSGLVLWWPRAHRWIRALFARPRGSWRRVNYRLHEMTGAWSALGLLVLAITGASLVFHDEFRTAINVMTASEQPAPPPPSVVRAGGEDASLEKAMARAEAALPGGVFTWVYLPTSPTAPLAFRKQLTGEWHPNGRSYVYVDRYTGEVLEAHDALNAPLGTRIYDVLYPLHIGRFGLWSKLLYAALGLAPLLLAIGGTLIWWGRRARKRTVADGRKAPVDEIAAAA